MIQGFQILGEQTRRWFGSCARGEQERTGAGCGIFILNLEPTPGRLATLAQRGRRIEACGGAALAWLAHGRAWSRSLFVAEQLFGEPLGRREGRRLRDAAMSLAEVLDTLHGQSLVHGALMPEFLWESGGEVRLGGLFADLGQARAWGPFDAPERRLGLPWGPESDVYSLGVCLHSLAQGQTSGQALEDFLQEEYGWGALLARSPSRRPSAAQILAARGAAFVPALGGNPAHELALRAESELLRGMVQDWRLLRDVACEMRAGRPVFLRCEAPMLGPFGLVRSLLARQGAAAPEPGSGRPGMKQALEAALGDARVVLVGGWELGDEPSQRLLEDVCEELGRSLLISCEGVRAPSLFQRLGPEGRSVHALERVGSSDGLALCAAAASVPPRLALDELAAVAGVRSGAALEEAADRLVRDGVLERVLDEEGMERYGLSCPEHGERLLERLTPEARSGLHLRAASLLELWAWPDEQTAFWIFFHGCRGGFARPEALRAAVRQCFECGDVRGARNWLREGEAAFLRLEPMERIELLEQAEHFELAMESCRKLLAEPSGALLGPLHLKLGRLLRSQAHFDEARLALCQAWESREAFSLPDRASILLDLAHLALHLGRIEEAAQWLECLEALGGLEQEPLLRGRHFAALGDLQQRLGHPSEALREFRRARQALPSVHQETVFLLTKMGKLAMEQEAMDEALQCFRDALGISRRLGSQSLEHTARLNLGWLLVQAERLPEAAAELDSLLALPILPSLRSRALGLRATLEGVRGELPAARASLAEARQGLRASDQSLRLQFSLDEALFLLDHGHLEEAEALLSGLEPPSSGPARDAHLSSLALLKVLRGRVDEAEKIFFCLQPCSDPVFWEARGEAWMSTDPQAALEAFEKGLALRGRLSSGYRRAMILARQARALQRLGQTRKALLSLREAILLHATAPLLAQKLELEFEDLLKRELPPSSLALFHSLARVQELAQEPPERGRLAELLLGELGGLLEPLEVSMALLHPITGEARWTVYEAQTGTFSPKPPEPCPQDSTPQRTPGGGWICGIVLDGVALGCLKIEGTGRLEPASLKGFLHVYGFLAALALSRAQSLEPETPPAAEAETPENFLVGRSPAMIRLMENVRAMAASDLHVLILGESGVGKTELAQAIHKLSSRRGQFFPVDLAAEPTDLVSANLFGHEKGAFTGAVQAKEGYIASCTGGTLFLDEIGDIPPEVQQKLLLFLQNKTYRTVGSNRERSADVRLILATNKNLEAEIAAGRFRQDLYWRLSGLVLNVPPLRERKEDIPAYCKYFFERCCKQQQRKLKGISPAAMAALVSHTWPGNLRDLMNCLQRAVVLAAKDGWIEPRHLSFPGANLDWPQAGPKTTTLLEAREALERSMILEALEVESYNRSRAARRLDITRQGLLGMMRRYGIEGKSP